jgi:hypothetical protein
MPARNTEVLVRASPALALALAAWGCGSDAKFTASAKCDGVKQEGEDTVDSPFDADGDGYFSAAIPDCRLTYEVEYLDCDDGDVDINPAANEIGCNGEDDDCNVATPDEFDGDGDGYFSCEDCDDDDPEINPAALEISCNGLDDDCDEVTLDGPDADGDGANACADCDDDNANVYPGATEIACNDVDDDCNPGTQDGPDIDGDSYTDCVDCNDNNSDIHPDAEEICDDGIDQNCDGEIDEACNADYSGMYNLSTYVSYSCAYGLVAVDFGQMYVVDTYPTIAVSGQGGGQPGTMTGSFTSASDFTAQRVVSGACAETYVIDGTFTGENTFSGTFSASFSGSYCYDCVAGSWSVEGTR